MIKRFIFVEDGSIDLDSLTEAMDIESKIVVYRQGSRPPIVRELKEPAKGDEWDKLIESKDDLIEKLKAEVKKLSLLLY